MMRLILMFSCLVHVLVLKGQAPQGYYDQATGLTGEALQQALHEIIKDHEVSTYQAIWDHFELTDKKPDGTVWDIYSDVPEGTPPYIYNFFTDQCGNYAQEGDCYNREHSFPRSWFGGAIFPMNSDMHHIFPTDGFVNNRRDNYPFGEVSAPTWTSLNGSKLGNNTTAGYTGIVFEPLDEYKGDLARMHFYMATRYYGEDGSWPGSPSVEGAQLKNWALELMYEWHQNDPVSQKETNRNNAIYQIQQNRNPFVDHPEFVEDIWFTSSVAGEEATGGSNFTLYPNPASNSVTIHYSGSKTGIIYQLTITDFSGRTQHDAKILADGFSTLDISQLNSGFYLVKIRKNKDLPAQTFKLVVN